MQCDIRTADSGGNGTDCVSSSDQSKQDSKGTTRKIPSRVGLDWNKGGRLEEPRKRHLARKFLKIWILKTFGSIAPHAVKAHHQSSVLKHAFEGWKDEWWTSRKEWCLTTRADYQYRYYLYNLAFQHWQTFMSLQKEKKNKVQHAVEFGHRQLMHLAWNRWKIRMEMRMKKRVLESALEQKRLETLQSAWKVWQMRLQLHQNLHTMEKHVQTLHQKMLNKHWDLWQVCLEEAEGEHFQPLRETAPTKYSTFLQRSCFNQWRERVTARRHMQKLQHQVDVCFAKHMLTLCFKSWVELTLQRRLHKQRKHRADLYNQQRLYTWVFYTWWTQTEKHKDQMLTERIALLYEERSHLQRAWSCWKEKINNKEEHTVPTQMYLDTLLHETVTQWKDNSTETQDRRQACPQSDLLGRKWAVEKQKRCLHINAYTEEICRRQERNCLRTVVSVWRNKATLLRQSRLMEQQAQNHYQHFLQFKVFIAWREVTVSAESANGQQREVTTRFQMLQNQVRLLQYFRQWRKEAAHARTEKIHMERARWHHESKLFSKAMKAWNEHHNQYHINKVMKRQGTFLLRLKMYQKYFDLWKVKLQHRMKEAELRERALWHWSLTLQAKVLCGWRRWVTEQQIKQEQAAGAGQANRSEPLTEAVNSCLTYAAHMKDLRAGLNEDSQEQKTSRCVQSVVRSCALHWKQKALCEAHSDQEPKEDPQKKKSVSFSCTMPELTTGPPASEQGDEFEELRKLLANRGSRPQPCRPQGLLESPFANLHKQSAPTATTDPPEPVLSHLRPVSSICHTLNSRSDVLLEESSSSSFLQSSAYPDVHVGESSGLTGRVDATSLITELLSIQRDMNSYQQDRKQLRAWKKLKEVLQSWIETSGRDDQSEKSTVGQELKELEERINRLSTELAKRKPKMLLHAERIERLQTALAYHPALTASH